MGHTSKCVRRRVTYKLPIKHTQINMKIKDKFKNVSAFSFTTHGNELMICFNGFEEEEDMKEFTSFVFAKINMEYFDMNKENPSIH